MAKSSHAAASIPIDQPKPPQELTFAWARYIALANEFLEGEYARTGQWPGPPQSQNFYQPPMPGLAAPAPAPVREDPHHHKHSRTARRTGYDYRQSEYWTAAGLLIEEQAARPVAMELRSGCQHVLSLILAWLHFPLFNGAGARQGEWMTLGCDRMCKELRITSRNVLSYLYELERCGLVLPGRLETGIVSRLEFDTLKADIPMLAADLAGPGKDVACDYWQTRCIQQKSTFYRLKPGIARPSLSVFNPFSAKTEAERAEKDLGRTWDGPQMDVQSAFELEKGPGEVLPRSFPRPHDHESEYEHDMKEVKKGNVDKKVDNLGLKEEMSTAQLEKYTFLKSIHEEFPGCTCGEMSNQAATRLSSQYEMPVLTAALSKVSRDWARNGRLIENPIALFISQLPKQATRPTGGGRRNGSQQRSGPIDIEKYTTGKYAKLTQNN